jgi:hypothetical protein
MDQFYLSYDFSFPAHQTTPPPQPSVPLLTTEDIDILQSQADKVVISPLIRSYISSILIALRLHPHVVSTSISPRAVADIRALIQVSSLRDESLREDESLAGGVGQWTNAGFVPRAVELCTRFRVRIVGEGTTFAAVLEDVLDRVRAPF